VNPEDAVTDGPNAEQAKFWNDTAAPKWLAYQRVLDEQIGPLGRRVMDRARVARGERVLDVGCGCGTTSLELAARVGPDGAVLGVDLSAPMLARAEEQARAAGAGNVRFLRADAQTQAFERGAFDLVFSRFGIMFFADPPAAFANLRTALRPGGRLAFVCWQPVTENPWVLVPLGAAAQHIPLPPPPAPGAPGPFALGDPEDVRRVLAGGGFADVALEDVREMLSVGGGSVDDAVELLLELGPTGAALREADPAARPRVAAAVREALVPFATRGRVRLPSAAWIVTARA
jgi:SAM-dependent methyltransferase